MTYEDGRRREKEPASSHRSGKGQPRSRTSCRAWCHMASRQGGLCVTMPFRVLTRWPSCVKTVRHLAREAALLVVSVLARKGGTGKSTAVRCLAVEALKAGWRVVIVDVDPQPTCHRWGQRRSAAGISVPLVVLPAPGGLDIQVKGFFAQGVDFVLIDTPPTASPIVNAALGVSTAAIVVTRPNPEDLESVQESLRVAGAQRRPTGVILWQTPPDKRVRAIPMAREALKIMNASVCPTAVSSSISYPYAYAEGLTPQEREPEGRARAELADVWAWLQKEGIVSVPHDKVAKMPSNKVSSVSTRKAQARKAS